MPRSPKRSSRRSGRKSTKRSRKSIRKRSRQRKQRFYRSSDIVLRKQLVFRKTHVSNMWYVVEDRIPDEHLNMRCQQKFLLKNSKEELVDTWLNENGFDSYEGKYSRLANAIFKFHEAGYITLGETFSGKEYIYATADSGNKSRKEASENFIAELEEHGWSSDGLGGNVTHEIVDSVVDKKFTKQVKVIIKKAAVSGRVLVVEQAFPDVEGVFLFQGSLETAKEFLESKKFKQTIDGAYEGQVIASATFSTSGCQRAFKLATPEPDSYTYIYFPLSPIESKDWGNTAFTQHLHEEGWEEKKEEVST